MNGYRLLLFVINGNIEQSPYLSHLPLFLVILYNYLLLFVITN